MWVLLGWEFVLGEFVGGPMMIILLALVFRRFLSRRLVQQARTEAEKGHLGQMEGHAEMGEPAGLCQGSRSPHVGVDLRAGQS
jgi:uncharacterized protein